MYADTTVENKILTRKMLVEERYIFGIVKFLALFVILLLFVSLLSVFRELFHSEQCLPSRLSVSSRSLPKR
jgi:hypothetical protein